MLSTPHATPEDFYRNFEHSAKGAVGRVKALRADWATDETSRIIQEANRSRRVNPKLGPLVTKGYADTTNHGTADAKVIPPVNGAIVGQKNIDADGDSTEDQARSVVEAFKQANPSVIFHGEENDLGRLEVYVPAGAWKLDFLLEMDFTAHQGIIKVGCRGPPPVSPAIDRCVSARPRPNDLRHTLVCDILSSEPNANLEKDMLSQYHNLRTAKCDKCARLLDAQAMLPVARRAPKAEKAGNDEDDGTWRALHESCMDSADATVTRRRSR